MRGAYRPDGVASRGRLIEPSMSLFLSLSLRQFRVRATYRRSCDRVGHGGMIVHGTARESRLPSVLKSEAIMRRTHREAIARSIIRIATVLLAELGAVVATTGIVLAQQPAPVSKPVAIRVADPTQIQIIRLRDGSSIVGRVTEV